MNRPLKNLWWFGIGMGILSILLGAGIGASSNQDTQSQCLGANLSVTGFIDGQVFISYSVLLFNAGDKDEIITVQLTLTAEDNEMLNQVQITNYCMKQKTSAQLNGRLRMPKTSWDLVRNTKVTITKTARNS